MKISVAFVQVDIDHLIVLTVSIMVTKVVRDKNRTDRILNRPDIEGQKEFSKFEFKDEFEYLCDLVPEVARERLVIENAEADLIKKRGVLYLFVLDGKVIKIGSATTSFKDRVASYNCGKQAYRNNGTCSTTNYFVLQSLLKINKRTQVYAYFPESIEMLVFGEKETISLPAKRFEKKLNTHLKKKNELPIMCTQQ